MLTQPYDPGFVDGIAICITMGQWYENSIGWVEKHQKKTTILRVNAIREIPMILVIFGLEHVEDLHYIWSIVDHLEVTEEDIKTWISHAKAAIHILRSVWMGRVIDKTTNILLCSTVFKSVLLCGSDTSRMKRTTTDPGIWINHCLGRGGEGRGGEGRGGEGRGGEGRGGEGREGVRERGREGGTRVKSPIRSPTLRNIMSSNVER